MRTVQDVLFTKHYRSREIVNRSRRVIINSVSRLLIRWQKRNALGMSENEWLSLFNFARIFIIFYFSFCRFDDVKKIAFIFRRYRIFGVAHAHVRSRCSRLAFRCSRSSARDTATEIRAPFLITIRKRNANAHIISARRQNFSFLLSLR